MPTTTMFNMWRVTFNYPKNDHQIYRDLYTLDNSVREVESFLKQIPELEHQRYLKPLRNVRHALSTECLSKGWGYVKKEYLSDSTLKELNFVSDMLNTVWTEQSIASSELEELTKDVEELVEGILAGNLKPELKQFIITQLEKIRHAILQYRISGADGLKDALESTAGAIVLNGQLLQEDSGAEEVTKFKKIFAKLKSWVSVAYQVKELASEFGEKFLKG